MWLMAGRPLRFGLPWSCVVAVRTLVGQQVLLRGSMLEHTQLALSSGLRQCSRTRYSFVLARVLLWECRFTWRSWRRLPAGWLRVRACTAARRTGAACQPACAAPTTTSSAAARGRASALQQQRPQGGAPAPIHEVAGRLCQVASLARAAGWPALFAGGLKT
jgi:hypothetical protein